MLCIHLEMEPEEGIWALTNDRRWWEEHGTRRFRWLGRGVQASSFLFDHQPNI